MAAGGGRSRSQRRLAVGGGDGCGRRAGEERSVCANGRCRSSPVGDSVTAKANALLATATAKAKAATRSNRELRKASDGGTSDRRPAAEAPGRLVTEAKADLAAGGGGEGGPGGRRRRRPGSRLRRRSSLGRPVAEAEAERASDDGRGGGASGR
uniref:Uncharacterized protein n=1 Tax=Oryza sativa subsp. japonica TaxID=39947 RepID=Q9FW96_ORYSJ|nr:hypothetical protein [Oryza sativa Japonica Group]